MANIDDWLLQLPDPGELFLQIVGGIELVLDQSVTSCQLVSNHASKAWDFRPHDKTSPRCTVHNCVTVILSRLVSDPSLASPRHVFLTSFESAGSGLFEPRIFAK